MSKYLIVGRAGSGKSSVALELKKRGYHAFDTDDIEGLSSWVDYRTKQPVHITDNTYVDRQRYGWFWDDALLRNFIKKYDDIFVCGGADNDLDFTDVFTKTFVLKASPDIQIMRLKTRTNNDYGQDPRMFPGIIDESAHHLEKAMKAGAIVLDADKPLAAVVDQIEGHTYASR